MNPSRPLHLTHHTDVRPLRDLMIFEQRVAQNLRGMRKRRVRILLGCWPLVLSLAVLKTAAFLCREQDLWQRWVQPLVPAATALHVAILLCRIVRELRNWSSVSASLFKKRLRKSLVDFHLSFDTDCAGRLSLDRRLPRRMHDLFDGYRREWEARRRLRPSPGLSPPHD